MNQNHKYGTINSGGNIMNQLDKIFQDIFYGGDLVRMILSAKRKKSHECNKVVIRPVKIGLQLMFQVEYHYEKKVTHANLEAAEAIVEARRLLDEKFKQINIFTASEDIQVLASKPSKPRITTKPATRGVPDLSHNRTKKYAIPNGQPCDFLIRLGVMDDNGRVVDKHLVLEYNHRHEMLNKLYL